jgi:sugar phosphate isomerase/epimerase
VKKIALVIAPVDAQPSALVVFRDRLEVSIAKAARLGYDGVELALGQAGDANVGLVRSLLAEHGMGLSAVSTGRVFAEQKAWLSSPDPAVRERAVRLLCGLVDLAAELGAARVNIGRVRGGIADGETLEQAEARFAAGVRAVADHASPHGVNLVVEPVNRYELNYINSVDPDGIALISRIGHPNVKLMADVFHMNIEDASIGASLRAAGPMVGYCHLADSNRWAPGQGHTDFPAILAALDAIGYDDWIGVEILPYPSADEAAAQAITYLRTLIPAASA